MRQGSLYSETWRCPQGLSPSWPSCPFSSSRMVFLFFSFYIFSFYLTVGPQNIVVFCRLYSYRPSYNVAPGSYMPVLRRDKDGVAVHCMKWGLVPGFTKKTDKPDFFKMVKTLLFWFYICLSSLIPVLRYWSYFLQFNARSESIAEKASFRRLLPKNRCLVAVDGYLYYLFYYS